MVGIGRDLEAHLVTIPLTTIQEKLSFTGYAQYFKEIFTSRLPYCVKLLVL